MDKWNNERREQILRAKGDATAFAYSVPGVSDVPSRKIRVACIGDSIRWGYAMTNR